MNKLLSTIFISLFLLSSVYALTVAEARQAWLDSKQASLDAQTAYGQARLDYAANTSNEVSEQAVINTGKSALLSALDEAEAWLKWKSVEVDASNAPSELKATIQSDILTKLGDIDTLKASVAAIDTRLKLGISFLEIMREYFNILGFVSKNVGLVWADAVNQKMNLVSSYESTLREAAGNNTEILSELDLVKEELINTNSSITSAVTEYNRIVISGAPLQTFVLGNNYLRAARGHLVSAVAYLRQAYVEIAGRGVQE
jgi:hypothetical protein